MNGDKPVASYNTTLAFSVDQIRRRLNHDIQVPKELVNKALKKLDEKLDAKETKFFTHQGMVIEKAVVEDHASQLSAIDKTLSMAGLYARERETRAIPLVALEVDPRTGVLRMVVGGGDANEVAQLQNNDTPGEPSVVSPQPALIDSQNPLMMATAASPSIVEEESSAQVIKVRHGHLSDKVKKILFGEDDG